MVIVIPGLVFLLLLKTIIEQPKDACPYNGKTSFYKLTYPKKRCGVRDTVASVPATFLLLFSSPEKRRYPFKASHSGRSFKYNVFKRQKNTKTSFFTKSLPLV